MAVPPPTDSSGSSAAAASAIRSLVLLLLLLATCLLVSVEALWVGAKDDTVGATRSVGWGDEGLNANDGVAARTKARAAAIPADLIVPCCLVPEEMKGTVSGARPRGQGLRRTDQK